MKIKALFEHQVSFRIFDTQFCAQAMENIGEIWYFLVPFLIQGGPSGVLFLVSSNMEVLFFNCIPEGIPCGEDRKYCRFLCGPFLRVSIALVLNMGDDLEECKSNFFPIGKLWTKKHSLSIFNHLSTTSTSISPSNNGISKFTCTLKGVAWPLEEDVSPVGSRIRIYAKLSIIVFLYCTRASSSNILKGFPAPSYFFSSPMGCCRA
jgi:hypothetical protein